jgi:uncharacterized membrane protein YhaH (DUF805 family)
MPVLGGGGAEIVSLALQLRRRCVVVDRRARLRLCVGCVVDLFDGGMLGGGGGGGVAAVHYAFFPEVSFLLQRRTGRRRGRRWLSGRSGRRPGELGGAVAAGAAPPDFQELPYGGHKVEDIYNLLMFSGRLGRLGYLIGNAYLLVPYILSILGYGMLGDLVGRIREGGSVLDEVVSYMLYIILIALLVLWVLLGLGISVRRFHDTDNSGWFILLGLIPIVNFFAGLYLLFGAGTSGDNQYGAPGNSYGVKFVLFGRGSSSAAPSSANFQER